ncbi:hypothetical protein Tco_0890420 [Tanacetum coccineum]|uniref:Uncharacterized protein n=1 Tax=Tanacetum coccineum TaxID=301880 RepID=A0ABQ5C1J8_9ASTR
MAENSFSKSLKKSKSSKQLIVGSGDGSEGKLTFSLSFSESVFKSLGLESVSIRRIQGIGYGVLEFLRVGTTFDIFQNILFPYSLNTAYCLSWIRRIGLVSFVVFGGCPSGASPPLSPDYVSGLEEPEQAPLSPEYVPEPVYPEYLALSDDDVSIEYQPLPADALSTALSSGYIADSDPKEDPEEDPNDDLEVDPADYPIDEGDEEEEQSSRDDADDKDEEEASVEEDDDEEEEEHLAPADTFAIPIDDIVPLTPMAAATEALITAVVAALPSSSPPLSPLTPLSSLLPQNPSLPLPLPSPPLPLPAPSSPFLLPATDCREDVPEAKVSPQKRLYLTTPAPRFEVGYGGESTTTLEELSQRVTDLAATLARDTHEMRCHLHTAMLLEKEARHARQAWSHAMYYNRAVHAELLEYRAEVKALHEQISVLQRQRTKDSDILTQHIQ